MTAVAVPEIAGVRRSARWVLFAAFAAGACASGARGTTEADGGPDPAPLAAGVPGATGRGSPNVLTGDELRETRAANLWDALRQLRPQWLRARASSSLISGQGGEPVVYVHNVLHGPLRTLQQMNIDQVRRVEFIDGRDATTRFGTGHGGGVIMVDLDRS
jgi:hypothetical protein